MLAKWTEKLSKKWAQWVQWFKEGDDEDLVTLSMLVAVMSTLLLGYGVVDFWGILVLIVQIGLLVRMNYVHRKQVQRQKETVSR